MIDVQSLTKIYGHLTAISDLTFSIDKGEVVGVLGANGAGKTTAMKILTCFMPPTSGNAFVNGLSIHDDSYAIRQMIGYLPENNPLYLDMTVSDYLDFIARIRNVAVLERAKKIKRVLELCQIGSVYYKPIDSLSKGFKQRVGLAQALIHEPEVLILDEPTVGLDPKQIIDIRKLIRELGKQATIIICSHILSEVAATCSKVFILKEGRIVISGTPEYLIHQVNQHNVVYFETDSSFHDLEFLLSQLEGVISFEKKDILADGYIGVEVTGDRDFRRDIFSLMVSNAYKIQELTMKKLSLEDVFIDLTKEAN